MPRQTPPDRLHKLIDAAAAAFVEAGFQRTQMDDVAARLGVSKGTVYRSVDSKESLFAAVLLYADTPERLPDRGSLDPIELADLSAIVRDQLGAAITGLDLATAASGTDADEGAAPGDEVERLALELFTAMATHRVRLMVLDRCAAEIPELAGDWYDSGRYTLEDLWVSHLDRQADTLGTSIDHRMLARTIVELITLWAVKMPWDPAPRPYDADPGVACAALVRRLVTGATT